MSETPYLEQRDPSLEDSSLLKDRTNLLNGIRIMDLFLATQRKLVADQTLPLMGTNLTGEDRSIIGSTGAILQFPNLDMLDCIIISGINTGEAIYQVPIDNTVSGKVYETKEARVINNMRSVPESVSRSLSQSFGIGSLMCTPVHHGDMCFAVLSVYAEEEDSFSPEVIQAVKVIASLLGAILAAKIELSVDELEKIAQHSHTTIEGEIAISDA